MMNPRFQGSGISCPWTALESDSGGGPRYFPGASFICRQKSGGWAGVETLQESAQRPILDE